MSDLLVIQCSLGGLCLTSATRSLLRLRQALIVLRRRAVPVLFAVVSMWDRA